MGTEREAKINTRSCEDNQTRFSLVPKPEIEAVSGLGMRLDSLVLYFCRLRDFIAKKGHCALSSSTW